MQTRMLVVEAALCLAAACSSTAFAAPAQTPATAHPVKQPEIVCNMYSCRTITPAPKPKPTQTPETPARDDTGTKTAPPHQ